MTLIHQSSKGSKQWTIKGRGRRRGGGGETVVRNEIVQSGNVEFILGDLRGS